jgi:hypothetical protein
MARFRLTAGALGAATIAAASLLGAASAHADTPWQWSDNGRPAHFNAPPLVGGANSADLVVNDNGTSVSLVLHEPLMSDYSFTVPMQEQANGTLTGSAAVPEEYFHNDTLQLTMIPLAGNGQDVGVAQVEIHDTNGALDFGTPGSTPEKATLQPDSANCGVTPQAWAGGKFAGAIDGYYIEFRFAASGNHLAVAAASYEPQSGGAPLTLKPESGEVSPSTAGSLSWNSGVAPIYRDAVTLSSPVCDTQGRVTEIHVAAAAFPYDVVGGDLPRSRGTVQGI